MLSSATPQPLKSAPDVIAEALRQEIFTGSLSEGTQLKQMEIAVRFGVSAVPVREAFQKLVAEGLAVNHRNRGVVVAPASKEDIEDIAELRALLEPHALRLSAPKLTKEDLAEAEKTLRLARASNDTGEQARLHWRFHKILYSRAPRPRLIAQIDSLFVNMNRYIMPMWSARWLSAEWEKSHMAILRAVRSNNIDRACQLITDQIFEAVERVVARMRAKSNDARDDT